MKTFELFFTYSNTLILLYSIAMHKHKISTKGFFDKPTNRFINRELSWLEFNWRVLEEAQNADNPLIILINFFSILIYILNEFYMVIFVDLKNQFQHNIPPQRQDVFDPLKKLKQITKKKKKLIQTNRKTTPLHSIYM